MGDPAGLFAQYGAIGIIATLALIAVKVLFQYNIDALRRERERSDRLEEELRKLNELVRTDYVTTIAQASKAIGDANSVVTGVLSGRIGGDVK